MLADLEAERGVVHLGGIAANNRNNQVQGQANQATAAQHGHRFTGPRTHTVVPGVGHNMPQEVPAVFADAVLRLVQQAWPGRLPATP